MESETGTIPPAGTGVAGTQPSGGGVFTFPARGQYGPIVSQATGLCLETPRYQWGAVRLATCDPSEYTQTWHYDGSSRMLDHNSFGITDGRAENEDPIILLGHYNQSTREVLIFDHLVPAVPAITVPADGTPTNNTAPTLSGTGSVNDTIQVKDQFGKVWCDATVQPGGTWSCAAKAGSGAPVRDYTLTIDTVPPPAPVLAHPADGSTIATPAPEFSGTGETGSGIVVLTQDGTEVCSATEVDDAWSCDPAAQLPEGEHALTAVSTDSAGNTATSAPVGVTVDVTAPSVPAITGLREGAFLNTPTPPSPAPPGNAPPPPPHRRHGPLLRNR